MSRRAERRAKEEAQRRGQEELVKPTIEATHCHSCFVTYDDGRGYCGGCLEPTSSGPPPGEEE